MFHWLLMAPQALEGVLQVAESLSNKKMRTFSLIRAHQSTSERININLSKRKTKPASVSYLAVVIPAANKTYGGFFDEFIFCVVEHHSLKITFHRNAEEYLFHFLANVPAYISYIGWPVSDIIVSSAVAYLYKMAPMSKFNCAPFPIISTLDIRTIFTKDKP